MPGGARDLWVGHVPRDLRAAAAALRRAGRPAQGLRHLRRLRSARDADPRSCATGARRAALPAAPARGAINRAKNEAIGPERFEARDEFERVGAAHLRDLRSAHERSRARSTSTISIFRLVDAHDARTRSCSRELQHRYDHVLVDEYQDTNHVQYLLLRGAVRAPPQPVRGRRRRPEHLPLARRRPAQHPRLLAPVPDARVVKLEQNYRSTQRILRVANAVIGNNVDREPKTLWTDERRRQQGRAAALRRRARRGRRWS